MKSVILADIAYYFHIFIVLFVLFIPFTNTVCLLLIHFVFCVCLLVHWGLNENICALSVIEAHFRGIDRTGTFTHSLIAPVYDIGTTEWSDICYILTIVLMYISLYKIISSDRWELFITMLKKVYHSKSNLNIIEYLKCLKPLLSC